MAYSSHNIKYDVGISLNLYGKPLDFKIMHALGESVLNYPRIARIDDTDPPYLLAVPSKNMLCGDAVWDKYNTYPVQGLHFKIEINANEYENYAFAFFRSNPDNVDYRTYKEDGGELTFGQFEYIQGDDLSPVLLGVKNGNVTEIAKYFSEYTINRQTMSVDFGNYTADRTITMQHLFASQSNWNYDGCAPKFYSNVAVFDTIENATNYLLTGSTEGSMEEEEEEENPDEELTSTVLYYYDTMETYEDLGMTKPLNTYHKQIIVRGEELPVSLERTLVTYSVNTNGRVDFHVANGGDQYLTNVKINNMVEYDINDNLPHNLTYYITNFVTCGFGMYYDPINEYYVKNTIRTNMRGVGANGELMPPESIGLNGDEMVGNSNSADYDVGLSECWILTKESVQALGKKFNTTVDRSQDNSSAYVVGDWILGLSAYANPLDVVCDLFYLPVDVSDFVNSSIDYFTFSPIESGEE